ncbi:hypothetical protein G7Y89_g10105 [Cudoniella acicularis]|uniref:Uncharacterized protein n=1 Tax=Cudoniella acicularis TaxID=354080 RepID=A0A8H4W197_9HELO|nr:hypothetical protein G7Y89_g10105 [Cudoniella acicularis]
MKLEAQAQEMSTPTPIKRKLDKVEEPTESTGKRKKVRVESPTRRKQKREDRRRSPATLKLIKPLEEWYDTTDEEDLLTEVEVEDEEMGFNDVDDDEMDDDDTTTAKDAAHAALLRTIYRAKQTPPVANELTISSSAPEKHGKDMLNKSRSGLEPKTTRLIKAEYASNGNGNGNGNGKDSLSQAVESIRRNSLSKISTDMFTSTPSNLGSRGAENPLSQAVKSIKHNSLSKISTDMFASSQGNQSRPPTWSATSGGSPAAHNSRRDPSSPISRPGTLFHTEAEVIKNWEQNPGKIRGPCDDGTDAEKEESEYHSSLSRRAFLNPLTDIAFSQHYISSKESKTIAIDGNTFSIINLAPGAICQLNVPQGVKICTVARGGEVLVKWRTRKVRRTFRIGQDGVWRVRGGEYCSMTNEGDEDDVAVYTYTDNQE